MLLVAYVIRRHLAARPESQRFYKTHYGVSFEEAMSEPESTEAYVLALAQRCGVRYVKMLDDDLADVITHLSDDEVVPDDIENLIVAMKRAGVISGAEMVDLLSRYLTEKYRID